MLLVEGGMSEHCDAPVNMACVAVKRVVTSAAESTLLYMRKSFSSPFKKGSHQLLFPRKLLDLSTDLGYRPPLMLS